MNQAIDAVVSDQWEQFRSSFSELRGKIQRTQTINLNSVELRKEIETLCRFYLRSTKPLLETLGLAETILRCTALIGEILLLTEGKNAVSSYKKQFSSLKKEISSIDLLRETATPLQILGKSNDEDDQRLIETLSRLVPSAALSYEQAIADLAEEKRKSFRGPALELREALRETLDVLAPDNDVMGEPNYKHEKDRSRPTMKQKVRFILSSRGIGKTKSAVPEQTVISVEDTIGGLTRSVYDLSSVATHVASERRQVLQLKRYVNAVLHDILEL